MSKIKGQNAKMMRSFRWAPEGQARNDYSIDSSALLGMTVKVKVVRNIAAYIVKSEIRSTKLSAGHLAVETNWKS